MFTWIPTYLKEEREPVRRRQRGLPVRGHRGRVPRLPERGLRARPARPPEDASRCSRRWPASRWSRTSSCRSGSNTTLLIIGFPLGFFASGCFSGFGSYLSELYPTRARGTGSGFCYNVGRAFGALFPGIIGFLATAIGLGGAVAFGVFGYVLAIAALRFLPETHGKELAPVE